MLSMSNQERNNEQKVIELRKQQKDEVLRQKKIQYYQSRIVELQTEILKLSKAIAMLELNHEPSEKIDPELRLERLLTELGIGYNLLGRQYLKAAIIYVFTKKEKRKMCQDVYPTVAREFNTTKRAVERGIRYAISRAILQDTCKLREIFSSTVLESGKVKNSEFIYGIIYFLNKDK